jgi:hypothetical protein
VRAAVRPVQIVTATSHEIDLKIGEVFGRLIGGTASHEYQFFTNARDRAASARATSKSHSERPFKPYRWYVLVAKTLDIGKTLRIVRYNGFRAFRVGAQRETARKGPLRMGRGPLTPWKASGPLGIPTCLLFERRAHEYSNFVLRAGRRVFVLRRGVRGVCVDALIRTVAHCIKLSYTA